MKQRAAIAPAVERTLGKGESRVRITLAAPSSLYHLIQPIELLHFMCLHGDWCETR